MGLLVHAMILGVTSVGGVVAGVRLGVWRTQLGVSAEAEAAAPDQQAMDPDGPVAAAAEPPRRRNGPAGRPSARRRRSRPGEARFCRVHRADAVNNAPIPDWAVDAARRLAVLGFVDVHGSAPEAPGGPRLLVALRSVPDPAHFDPETIGYWAFDGLRGRPASFNRADQRPAEREVSWGRLHVADRIPVANEFLSFGGRLRAVGRRPRYRRRRDRISRPDPPLEWPQPGRRPVDRRSRAPSSGGS